ncbi:RagB/SusD family nutrient uptake outer membrane protein [soil metagenome]
MKYNKIKALTIVVVLASITYLACNKKVLDVPPPTISEVSFFKSEAEFRRAIVGVYAGLIDYYSTGNHGGGGGGTGGQAMLEVWFKPSDDITTQNANDGFEYFDGLTPSTGKLDQVFRSSYVFIGRANKVIEKIRSAPQGLFVTTGLKDANEGEMLFLRSFGHYMLWNVFGTAPVDTIVVDTPEEFGLPNSKNSELLDQCITDLTRAATLLPATWPITETGRITKNAAYGLLGKCLVFRASATKSAADYQAAIAAFDMISGASLTTNFYDNFDVNKENNQESLFEFQAGKNLNGFANAWLSNDAADVGVAGAFYQMFYDGPSGASNGRYRPTQKLKDAFNPADPRFPLTIDPIVANNSFIKYIVGGDALDGAVMSLNNFRILRFADVLLLKAEAVLQSGGSTATAIQLVNDVRTRARNMVSGGTVPADFSTAQTDKNIIMGWIMDERLRELAGEGQRWFDIRRWQLAGYITLNNAFFSSLNPASMKFETTGTPNKYIYFPIPVTETTRNANIVQNPGY